MWFSLVRRWHSQVTVASFCPDACRNPIGTLGGASGTARFTLLPPPVALDPTTTPSVFTVLPAATEDNSTATPSHGQPADMDQVLPSAGPAAGVLNLTMSPVLASAPQAASESPEPADDSGRQVAVLRPMPGIVLGAQPVDDAADGTSNPASSPDAADMGNAQTLASTPATAKDGSSSSSHRLFLAGSPVPAAENSQPASAFTEQQGYRRQPADSSMTWLAPGPKEQEPKAPSQAMLRAAVMDTLDPPEHAGRH